jgi:hypothetical protein
MTTNFKNMKNANKWLAILGVGAAMLLSQQAQAIPTGTLTLSDNNGNTTGPIATSAGVASFNGGVGFWNVNVSTGIGGGTTSFPTLDLNSIDNFLGGVVGNVLTINFTLTGLGPLSGGIFNGVGGTANGVSDVFQVLINGVPVTTSVAYNTNPFSGAQQGSATGGFPSTVSIVATLTGGANGGLTSFDDNASVPDGGTTVMLLGAAFSGLCLFRKKIMGA